MNWFCYEMGMTGRYAPCLYAEKPGKKTAGSHTPRRKGLVQIKEDEQDLHLDILARIYPLPTDGD